MNTPLNQPRRAARTFFWVLLTWVPFRANDIYTDKTPQNEKTSKLLIRTSAGFQDVKEHDLIYPFSKTIEWNAATVPGIGFGTGMIWRIGGPGAR